MSATSTTIAYGDTENYIGFTPTNAAGTAITTTTHDIYLGIRRLGVSTVVWLTCSAGTGSVVQSKISAAKWTEYAAACAAESPAVSVYGMCECQAYCQNKASGEKTKIPAGFNKLEIKEDLGTPP